MREELLSVGIDIGTSTTQLIFSKLIVENEASAFTVPRISIVDKEIIYRSEVYFTPLISNTEIDGRKIKEIIEEEYKKAGINKDDIQSGAVIITGETARKENANDVLHTEWICWRLCCGNSGTRFRKYNSWKGCWSTYLF